MSADPRILLTGATGLLGRYLLRDLLLEGERVAVLARDTRTGSAVERIQEIVQFWSERLGRRLPNPLVLHGDVRSQHLGLDVENRAQLAGCEAVLHSAASLTFRPSSDGEPAATNVEGTRNLLDCCGALGISQFHYVSTAFVCGDTAGPVLEDDNHGERRFHNVYEQSKWAAEQLIRATPGICATFYRPSVIVGDSRTGYTSTYHGPYRFVELASRLAEPPLKNGQRQGARRHIALRLPLTGSEPRDLVPVDWVAQAIVRLMRRSEWHGRTFHLTSPEPVSARLIKEVAETVNNIEGVCFAGRDVFADPSPLEQVFLDHLEEYWTYLGGDPQFDSRNVAAALPDLPPVQFDGPLLTRLFEFAASDQWGKKRRARTVPPAAEPRLDCRKYVEETFSAAAQRSKLARSMKLNAEIALDIRGQEGGQWTLRWTDGELTPIRRGIEPTVAVVYRTDVDTFADLIRRKQTVQAAFLAGLIEAEGDIEMALRLSVMLGEFLADG